MKQANNFIFIFHILPIKSINRGANLYPVNAPIAVGIGNTMNFPNDVTYLGRLITLPR